MRNGRSNTQQSRSQNRGKAVTMTPNTIVVRKLHRMATVGLNSVNANGGTEAFVALNTTINQFGSASEMLTQYEKYRIRNLKIEIRPNCQNVGGLSDAVDRIAACYALNNFSTAEMFYDPNTETAPDQEEVYGRDKLKIYRINPDAWKCIGDFRPKPRFTTSANALPALISKDEWLSTDFPDIPHVGLRGVFKQDSSFWGATASDSARFSVYFTATVEFQGYKSGP